ncbi:MAG: hypothetical protein HQ538_03145 [Parcubacteria group bacterium]|nr:hypothetical protein [Parcubacteria group bacterium]
MQQDEYKTLTKSTEKLIQSFEKKEEDKRDKGSPKIKVNKTVSKLAFLYERIRNVIDYKDEHLLRKNAVRRVLKRRLTNKSSAKKISGPMVFELIRGGYLENENISENKIERVEKVIDKYISLLNLYNNETKKPEKEKKELLDWILGIAACEIEEVFASHVKDEAMADFMYQAMSENIAWSGKIAKEEKSIQVYIAIQRALLKSDREIITYRLMGLYYPNWKGNASKKLIEKIASNVEFLNQTIEDQIDHPLSSRLITVVKKYLPSFVILKDVLEKGEEDTEDMLSNIASLTEKAKEACEEKYSDTRVKLRRSGVRSIIYIFISKMLLALAIEVPYDVYFASQFDYTPLIVNVVFHPTLLFLILLTIRVPKEKNTENIIDNIRRMIFEEEENILAQKVKTSVSRKVFSNILFNFFYVTTFAVSFGAIIYTLNRFGFNAVGIFIFVLFLSLVSFFGIRNRESARELIISGDRESMITTLADFLAIPILRVGRWLSLNFSRINVFVFILDFIIEAPFKAFIEITEDFFTFIREKKEEITMK